MKFLSLFLCAFLFTASAHATSWAVDNAQSSIEFKASHAEKEFTGRFEQWTATIDFDPAQLDAAKAEVKIDLSSAKTGEKMYDGTLPQKEWFNTKEFPEANFVTKTFRKLDGNQYEADGTLTIKGISKDITLPFTLDIVDKTAEMKATITLDRFLFDLGTASDPKAEWVTKDVAVTITVRATAP